MYTLMQVSISINTCCYYYVTSDLYLMLLTIPSFKTLARLDAIAALGGKTGCFFTVSCAGGFGLALVGGGTFFPTSAVTCIIQCSTVCCIVVIGVINL